MADYPAASLPAALPLVGRERQLAVLRDALARALAGRGSLVLIGGEAGIGKTALAEALLAEAAAQGATVLVGRCYDLAETPPYGPWAKALASTPGGGLASPPDLTGGAPTTPLAILAAVRGYLNLHAARQPIVLVLEDLHWADPASLEILRFVSHDLADLSLLLIATYRGDELAGHHPLSQLLPLLLREARATRLALRPLEPGAVRGLVTARYRLASAEEVRLVAYLQRRAEGNPLFLGELLHTLEDEGVLRQEGDGWALDALDTATVPALLRQLIAGRLARLGPATREALGAAAVIGHIVPFHLWSALIGRAEEGLLDLAAEACAARLLEEASDGTGARFVHALVREAVYEGVRPARRRMLHRRAGEVLMAAPDPDPDAVASHLVRAADSRAAEWLLRSGDRAHRAYAWLTAAARYEAALALAVLAGIDPRERAWLLFRLARLRRFVDAPGALPRMEEAARLAEQAGDHFLAAHARIGIGHLRCLAGDYRAGIPDLETGLAAVERLSEAEREAQVRLDATDRSFGWGTLVYYLAVLGRYDDARALEVRHAASVPDSGDVRQLGAAPHGDAQAALGLIHAALGRPEEARQMFAQARAAMRAVDHAIMVGWCAALEMSWVTLIYHPEHLDERRAGAAEGASLGPLSLIGWPGDLPSLWELPILVTAGRWRAVVSTAAVEGFSSIMASWRATMLARVAREQGDMDLTWRFVRRWLPDGPATEPGGVEFLEALHFQRLAAALAIDAGDLPAARTWLEAHDRWLAWNGTVLGRAEGQIGWSSYYRAMENTDQARERAKQALAHASDPRQPLALLAAHRFLGELDTADGCHDEAAGHLDAALALARACHAPYELALSLLALAGLQAAGNRQEDAARSLAEAHAVFTDLGAAPALARADALAARLAASSVAPTRHSAAPAAFPGRLSRREAEVLRLLAAGRSNQQIAQALFLSPRTVQRHVANAYLKIGAHNKADATTFALRHHLL